MSFQYITGRSHSGKTKYLLKKSLELCNANKPLIFVVPEQFTHIAEKRLISTLGFIAQGKAEVLSFDRMCKKINHRYPSDRKQLTSIGKSLIVSEVLSTLSLDYYSSAVNQNGFAQICSDQISEFKKYLISPKMLSDASENIKNKALALKMSDISKIYEAYQKQIETRFSDADDSFDILASNLEKHRPYEGVTFIFDEFSSFTPQEKSLISIITSQAENVYVSFCLDNSPSHSSIFKVTNKTAADLARVCKERGAEQLKSIRLNSAFYDNKELSFLEKNLFSDKASTYDGDNKNIKIFTAENPYTEVELLASNIMDLVRNSDARFCDIGVVCPDIDTYGSMLRSAFDECNIPYFIDEKVSVLDHSVVAHVKNILDVYLMQYSPESVISFLKSGCTMAERDAICYADNYITATRASKNTWLFDDRFEASINKFADGDMHKKELIQSIRSQYILSLAKLHDSIKGRNTVLHITEKIYNYLLETKFDRKIHDFIKRFKTEGNTYLARQYETVWNTLIDVFDNLVYILGDKTVNINEYRRYLCIALSQQKTGIIPTSLDEVVVGDLMRSKGEMVKYQFVIGAIDGAFPNTSQGANIITDTEKAELSAISLELSPQQKDKAFFDRLQIYSAFTHPTDALFVSYPASDADFKAVRPAFVIYLLQKIFPKLLIEGSISNNNENFFDAAKALEHLAKSAYLLSRGQKTDDVWKDIYAFFVKSGKADKIELINRLIASESEVTRLSPELCETLFANDFYSTISRIQCYNSCRYSYYLEYMLSLKEKKPFGVDSADVGTLIHSIIENVLNKLGNDNTALKNTDRSYFEKEVSEYLSAYISELTVSNGELTNREIFSVMKFKDAIINSLMALRDHLVNSAFEVMGCEISFDDDNSDFGCIELPLKNGKKVKIRGKIDRADSFTNEDGTFIRVVDYKTGNKTFNFTDVFYGLDVQLLVYMNALVNKTENAHPAGALYFRILNPISADKKRSDKEKLESLSYNLAPMDGIIADNANVLSAYAKGSVNFSKKLTSSQFMVLGDYINHIITESARSLSDGYIEKNPYSHQNFEPCQYCAYGSICDFQNKDNLKYRSIASKKSSEVFGEMEQMLGKSEV